MSSFETNSVVPEYLLIALAGLPKMIEDVFPLSNADRDELVRQIFDYFLNENELGLNHNFRPNLGLLRMSVYDLVTNVSAIDKLNMLAQNIYAQIWHTLALHRIADVVAAQGGFFYVMHSVLPSGYHVVLRNISPSILSTQKRYVPELHT